MCTEKNELIPGLVSVTFRGKSPEEIIREAKACGLSVIEWGGDVHAKASDPERLKEIAARMKEAGLKTCSYGTYLKLGECSENDLMEHIAAARILGTDILRVWAGSKGSLEMTAAEKESFLAACRTAAEIAARENIVLCLECHNNTCTDRVEGALEIMERVGSPALRMYWQPNQFRTVEENLRYAEKIAAYTVQIHVFNWDGAEKYPLRDAEDIWRGYFAAFTGTHAALLEFMPDDGADTLMYESRALKKIIEKHNAAEESQEENT